MLQCCGSVRAGRTVSDVMNLHSCTPLHGGAVRCGLSQQLRIFSHRSGQIRIVWNTLCRYATRGYSKYGHASSPHHRTVTSARKQGKVRIFYMEPSNSRSKEKDLS